jgi:hypothetical protein
MSNITHGDITAYDSTATYTLITEWVSYVDTSTSPHATTVYRPIPDQLPIAPTSPLTTAPDTTKWVVAKGWGPGDGIIPPVETYSELDNLELAGYPDGTAITLTGAGIAGTWVVGTDSASPQAKPGNVGTVRRNLNDSNRYVERSDQSAPTLKMFGAIGGGVADDTASVQAAFDYDGKVIDTGDTDDIYQVTDLTLSSVKKFIGEGTIRGATAGTKPVLATMAGQTSAQNLTTLQTYLSSEIDFTGSNTFTGELRLENLLILGGTQLTVTGKLKTTTCASHGYGLYAKDNGVIDNDSDFICSDPTTAGMEARFGGNIISDSNWVISPGTRGFRSQGSRSQISCIGASVRNATDEALFCHIGGSAVATSFDAQDGASIGVSAIYGGNIALSSSTISGNSGFGIVCESNSSIYAESSTVTNNNGGVSTSHEGFVQILSGTITGNTSYAIRNLNGGVVNAFQCTIDLTNNSGGVQIFSEGRGYVYAEEPGVGSGKTALTSASYSPNWKIIGNGMSYIGDYRDNSYPNDDTGISIQQLAISRRRNVTIASGAVTCNGSWQILNAESGTADTLDTLTRDSDNPIDFVILQAASGDTITVQHLGGGNIYLQGLANIVLDSQNKLIMLLYSKANSRWVQVQI